MGLEGLESRSYLNKNEILIPPIPSIFVTPKLDLIDNFFFGCHVSFGLLCHRNVVPHAAESLTPSDVCHCQRSTLPSSLTSRSTTYATSRDNKLLRAAQRRRSSRRRKEQSPPRESASCRLKTHGPRTDDMHIYTKGDLRPQTQLERSPRRK
jgi:hypothetical protein